MGVSVGIGWRRGGGGGGQPRTWRATQEKECFTAQGVEGGGCEVSSGGCGDVPASPRLSPRMHC